jgi:hypothetical protein
MAKAAQVLSNLNENSSDFFLIDRSTVYLAVKKILWVKFNPRGKVLTPLANRGGATLRCCLSAPPAYGISVFALFPLPRVRLSVFRI